MRTLDIGYSPCPNDTYIMSALAQGRVASPLEFRHILADVETLNQWALADRLDVTKLSFMALGKVRSTYGLLYSGAAMGFGCGPLVVARPGWTLDRLAEGIVAAPGELTTACLLLSLFLGREPRFKQMVFSDIMGAVSRGDADFGLIIHEGRFTFADHGLSSLIDLGAWWEEQTSLPIPLGGIAIRRDLGPEVARSVDEAIRRSLEMADTASAETMAYVRTHAQEMDPDVVTQHIGLYVNAFSRELPEEGRAAVAELFARAEAVRLIPKGDVPLMAYEGAS